MTDAAQVQDTPAPAGASTGSDQQQDTQQQTPVADAPLGAGDDAIDTPPAQPDWRQTTVKALAKEFGGEEKLTKQLSRYGSVSDVVKWALNAEKKISSGNFKRVLPENASEEELSTWRKENAVPDKPEAYSTDIGDGIVFGDGDKEIITTFLEDAHKDNMPQPYVNTALKWYHRFQEAQQVEQAQQDKEFKQETRQALRDEWGPEYTANLNALKTVFTNADEGLFEHLMGARAADGRKLGDHPGVLKWLTNIVREVNPAATVVPSGTGSAQSVDSEIAALEQRMRTDREGWYKDEAAQARLRQLYTAQEKIQKRA